MATAPIEPQGAVLDMSTNVPPMPAVARILARYDRPQVEAFVEVAIALLDTLDGDPNVEDGDEDCCPAGDDGVFAGRQPGEAFGGIGSDDDEEEDDPGGGSIECEPEGPEDEWMVPLYGLDQTARSQPRSDLEVTDSMPGAPLILRRR